MFKHEYEIKTDLGDKDHILYLKTNLSKNKRYYSLGKIEDGFFTITSNKPIDNFPSLDTLKFISALKHDEYEDELNKIKIYKENIYKRQYKDFAYNNRRYETWIIYNNLFHDFIFTITESLNSNSVVLNPVDINYICYAFKENIYQPQVKIKIKIKREHPYKHQIIDYLFNISYSYLIKENYLENLISKLSDVKIYKQLLKFCQNSYKYRDISIYQLIKIIQYYYFIERTCNDINEIQNKIMCFFNFMNELNN